jgi:hypothetical protein
MTSTKTITINDVDLDVVYSATKFVPATFHDPAEGGEVEIEDVYLEGNELSGMLADWVMAEILDKLKDVLGDDERQAEEDAAEAKAEARAEVRDMLEAA